MSREIKFRAWLKPRWQDDEDANKMYYDIQDSYDTLGKVKPYDPMDSFSSWFEDGVAIVEQYTGLKDKNGKEIYEGDIVTLEYDLENIGPEDYSVITFSNGCFRVGDGYENEAGSYLSDWQVIGNIHENPELLGE